MSLTILLNKKATEVSIIEWFFEKPDNSGVYAVEPIIHLSKEEFLSKGLDIINDHFEELAQKQLPEGKTLFRSEKDKEIDLVKDCFAVKIKAKDTGKLTLIPTFFKKQTLTDIISCKEDTWVVIPEDSSAKDFWIAFNKVLLIASNNQLQIT